MTTHSSSTSSPSELQYDIDHDHDRISKLPDELLQLIVSKLSTEEAVRTSLLSPRWVDVWKWRSHLFFDMRNVLETTPDSLHLVSVQLAKSMTKVINNHRGHLESCIIQHYVSQYKDGTLQSWIDSLTRLKHTKDLTLINYIPATRRYNGANLLSLPPNTFSHHSLSSLSLCGFSLIGPDAFSKCKNLKTLELINIDISQASVLTGVLAAFSSLEVIVLLSLNFLNPRGVLKIENNNLKFLQLCFPYEVVRMEVYAACLDVLDISSMKVQRDSFILVAPNIQVNTNAWLDDHGLNDCRHLYCNVSSDLAQGETNIWHEILGSDFFDKRRSGCLSVSVDITDPKEVEILKEVLLMWTDFMMELEIFFKHKKSHREEGEYSTNDRTHEKLFPNANSSCVWNVRLYNFDGSNAEEFAFVSRLVMQKPVIMKLMIETSLFPPTRKFNAEAAVAKLMELPKYYKNLKIECF